MIALLIFYLVMPAAVIWLCRKVSFFNKIGPILILYIIGVIAGNMPFMPENAYALQNLLSSALIPIAIPMLLFSANFRNFSVKKSLLTLICGTVAVVIAIIAGFLIFKGHIGGMDEPYKVGGMMTGVYTGGTPNLAALKLILGASDETYIMLNTYDMVASFCYLIFMMSVGVRFFRKVLRRSDKESYYSKVEVSAEATGVHAEKDSYVGIFKWKNFRQVLLGLGISIVILLISAGIAIAAGGGLSQGLQAIMDGKYFMTIIILSLTTLGIAASFIKPVQKLEKSYDGGMYLVYIFSIVVASMADLSKMDFTGSLYILAYAFFIIIVSLVIHTLLAKLFKIDADTMAISSVALINSPPFVPMIAAVMKNKNALITGLSIGIVGYAAGNYLGFIIAEILKLL